MDFAARPGSGFPISKANWKTSDSNKKSTLIPACFTSEKVICLVYVGNTLLCARNESDVDEVLRKLQDDKKMQLEIKDDMAGFLGVKITTDDKTGIVTLK